jgi:hypothetical protein
MKHEKETKHISSYKQRVELTNVLFSENELHLLDKGSKYKS